jgi:hypothetical protein
MNDNNKITKFIYALIGGLILILLAGSFYYSLNLTNKPVVITEEETLEAVGPVLSMSPSVVGTRLNTSVDINVNLDTKTETASAVSLVITYDPNLLTANAVTVPSNFFLPVKLLQPVINNGQIILTLGCEPTTPKKGIGTLATINFTTKGSGSALINYTSDSQVAVLSKNSSFLSSYTGATINIVSTSAATQ